MENKTHELTETRKTRKKSKIRTIDIVYTGIFAALIAVCSWISIPLTVPITLQTLGVCLAAALLGLGRGTFSVFIYILLGLIGLPVFAGFKGGIGVLFGSTGGYIIGFLFTALTIGLFTRFLGTKVWVLFLSMLLGIALCYAFGTAWFLILYNRANVDPMSLSAVLAICVTPFIPFDLLKILLSIFLCRRLKPHLDKWLAA